MSLFHRIDERTGLMGQMMQTVGVSEFVDTGMALEHQLRTAFFRCQACSSVEECKSWLAEGHVGAEPPAFCPNAEFFSTAIGNDNLTTV